MSIGIVQQNHRKMTTMKPASSFVRWLLITCISCLLWPCVGQAQPEKVWRDVTYSTHNYKHPNKAATARKWRSQTGVEVAAPASVASRNYKQPAITSDGPQGSIVLKANREQLDMNRNYKDQHPSPMTRDRRVRKARSLMDERPIEVESTGN